MKAYAVSMWLQTALGPGPGESPGEFSEAQVEAWKAEARLARRAVRIGTLFRRLAGPARMAQPETAHP